MGKKLNREDFVLKYEYVPSYCISGYWNDDTATIRYSCVERWYNLDKVFQAEFVLSQDRDELWAKRMAEHYGVELKYKLKKDVEKTPFCISGETPLEKLDELIKHRKEHPWYVEEKPDKAEKK